MILIRKTLLVTNKITQIYTKIKTEISIFVLRIHVVSQNISVGWSTGKKTFDISWIRTQIYYHRFYTLAEILNRDLSKKICQVIYSCDLMDSK